MREIEYYKTETGRCPVEDFIDSLTPKEAQKVVWVMRIVRESYRVQSEYFQKLSGTDDLWEVRAQFGGKSIRFLGFWAKSNFIVLTNGFDKKSEKTPMSEIHLAEQRKKDYQRRHKL